MKEAPPICNAPCVAGHHEDNTEWQEDTAVLGQLLGQMLVSWKRSAFYADNQMFGFAVQETKVGFIIADTLDFVIKVFWDVGK